MNLFFVTPLDFSVCLVLRFNASKSILQGQNRFWQIFGLFGNIPAESILASRRNENFLLFVKITFKGITKYRLLYLKINSNQINSNKINSI